MRLGRSVPGGSLTASIARRLPVLITIVSDTPRVRFETQHEGAGPRPDWASAICDGTQYRYLRVAV